MAKSVHAVACHYACLRFAWRTYLNDSARRVAIPSTFVQKSLCLKLHAPYEPKHVISVFPKRAYALDKPKKFVWKGTFPHLRALFPRKPPMPSNSATLSQGSARGLSLLFFSGVLASAACGCLCAFTIMKIAPWLLRERFP